MVESDKESSLKFQKFGPTQNIIPDHESTQIFSKILIELGGSA